MKIDTVTVYCLREKLENSFAFSQGLVNERTSTIVKISTTNGLVGWGECFNQGLEPPEISANIIFSVFKNLIIGKDPRNVEHIWFEMYHLSRDYGRKGSVISAISGIDIAIWDILGKFYKEPVYNLLGGAVRKKIKPYATGFYRKSDTLNVQDYIDEALMHFKNGFSCMKVKLGFGIYEDIEVYREIYKALEKKNIKLFVDTNHAYGRNEAIRLGLFLDKLDCGWYEEPVVPEDIDGYIEVKNKIKTPVAGGENEHTLFGFRDLIKKRAVDIAQPDLGSCGGITAMKHIIALCVSEGIQINPHVWGSSILQSASLQILASLPVVNFNRNPTEPLLEYDCSDHPFRKKLTFNPIIAKKGSVEIPSNHGIGAEVNEDYLQKYEFTQ